MHKIQAVGSSRFRFKAVRNRIIFHSLGVAETLHFLAANKPTRSCHKKHVRLLACLAERTFNKVFLLGHSFAIIPPRCFLMNLYEPYM